MEAADEAGVGGENHSFPRRAVFVISLPDALPVVDGAIYSRVFDEEIVGLADLDLELLPGVPVPEEDRGRQLVVAQFRQVPVLGDVDSVGFDAAGQVFDSLMGNESRSEEFERPEPIETYRTVAVVSAWAGEEPARAVQKQDPAPDLFTRCVDLLAFVFRGYRLAERARVPELTYERLPLFVLWCWQDTATDAFFGQGVFVLTHNNLDGSFAPEPLDADGIVHLHAVLDQLLEDSPVLLVNERMLEARISLWQEGDFGAAAVQSALACEVLFDAVLGLMLWEEQLEAPDTDAAVAALQKPLKPRVRHEYASRLGGDWSMTGDGPLARWAEHVAHLRNRVVHRGYRPTQDEAYASVEEASVELLDFVEARLVAHVSTYPRTALLIVSESRLRELGGWGRKIERFATENADTEPLWISAYRDWRDAVGARL